MPDRDAFESVAGRVVVDGRLGRVWRLQGGVSASMHGLEIVGPNRKIRKVVVRRHRTADWKPRDETVTATEFALLGALRSLGVAVPEPYLLDLSGELLPSPYLVMEWVEGTTVVSEVALPDAIRQMAVFLASLHDLDIEVNELPPMPEREDPRDGALQYLPSTSFPSPLLGERLRGALKDLKPPLAARPRSLVHGDFWPGNILWRDGRIAAVIDWEDAALGDPLSDLACCRVELLCQYGGAAMDALTSHYVALTGADVTGLALWEVYVSSAAAATMAQWGLPPEAEAKRRSQTLGFLERAGRELLETFKA